jgi:hypothetical protein
LPDLPCRLSQSGTAWAGTGLTLLGFSEQGSTYSGDSAVVADGAGTFGPLQAAATPRNKIQPVFAPSHSHGNKEV